jgi:hypothetical protein
MTSYLKLQAAPRGMTLADIQPHSWNSSAATNRNDPTGCPDNHDAVISLYADSISITRREVEGDTVRLTVQTNTREHVIDEKLAHTRVGIKRIPIGRIVDAAPPMRTEGDTIIIPVMKRWWLE